MHVTEPTTRTAAAPKVPLGPNRWATIRPIESGDRDRLFDFYESLSAEARRSRFLAASGGIARRAAQQFADADHQHRDGWVAILHEAGPADGAVIGHVCLEPDPAEPGLEELAVAVGDAFQHRGLGTALVATAVASARRRGVSRLTATMFLANGPMRRLLLHSGLPVSLDAMDSGVERMELSLAA